MSTGFRSRWQRFDGPSRLAGIDLARGLAVVGMLAAHLLVIEPFALGEATTWVDVVNGRSSILFATLAGVSIALVTGGTRPVRGAARARASGRLAVRAGLLWVLGMLLVSTGVPVYVILPAYAILFLLALPFTALPARVLFTLAAVLAVMMPFVQAGLDSLEFWDSAEGDVVATAIGWNYPFPVWIAFVLAGLAVGRSDLRSPRVAGLIAAAGTLLAVLGYGWAAVTERPAERASLIAEPDTEVWTASAHSSGLLEVVGSGGFALAVIGLALLVCRTPLRWLAIPFRAVGSMPLTAYTVQLLVWAVAAAVVLGDPGDLSGFRELEPFWPLTLGIVLGAVLWTLLAGRGPLEAGIDRFARWVVPSRGDGRTVGVGGRR